MLPPDLASSQTHVSRIVLSYYCSQSVLWHLSQTDESMLHGSPLILTYPSMVSIKLCTASHLCAQSTGTCEAGPCLNSCGGCCSRYIAPDFTWLSPEISSHDVHGHSNTGSCSFQCSSQGFVSCTAIAGGRMSQLACDGEQVPEPPSRGRTASLRTAFVFVVCALCRQC